MLSKQFPKPALQPQSRMLAASLQQAAARAAPATTDSSAAASATLCAIGPTQSREEAYATRPLRDTRPYVGFTPTTPQKEAGCRMLPPVSEPSAATTWLAATAEAEPPLLPPGTRSGSHGLWVGCTRAWPGRGRAGQADACQASSRTSEQAVQAGAALAHAQEPWCLSPGLTV